MSAGIESDAQECPSYDDALELSQCRAGGLLSLTGDVHASNLPVAVAGFDCENRLEAILAFVDVAPVFDGAGHRLRLDPRALAVLLGWLDRQKSLMR